jgi:mannose-6-phosphate isomerase-like protein (cupin superfamily)
VTDETIALGPHQTLRVVESNPDVLLLDARWEPGGNPPLTHLHPGQDERFEVLDGELTVRVGEDERVLAAGDTLEIPRGTAHAMWNAGAAPARASWRVTPALRTEEMFRTIASGGVEDFLERFAAEFRLGDGG